MKKLFFLLVLLWPAYAQAATYWVNSAASGSHCTNSASDPGAGSSSQTIAQGITCMVAAGGAGHTVKIHGGTYNEILSEPAGTVTFPHGSSWSIGGYNTIEAIAGETVLVQPTASGNSIIEQNSTSTPFYLWFLGHNRNFIVDAVNLVNRSAAWSNGPFIRFQSMEIKNAHGYGSPPEVYGCVSGLLTGADNTDIWDNNIHDNGCDITFGGYSIYAGHDNTSILDNWLHDNTGSAIQIYYTSGTPSGAVFARNRVYNNGRFIAGGCRSAGTFSGLGGVFVAGQNNKIYDNLIYNNCADALTSSYYVDNSNTTLYGNTIVNNGTWGLELNNGAIARNNIVSGNGGVAIQNNNGGYTADHNLCSNNCNGLGSSNQINEAASATFNTLPPTGTVTGTATTSFALKAGSLAINNGVTLGSPYDIDYANNTRTVPWDIGAYELVTFIPGPVTDNFDRTNGALGTNWSGGYSPFTDATIVVNKVRGTALGNNMIQVYAAPIGEIQAPTVTLATVGSGLGGDGALLLRASPTPTATYYYVGAARGSSDTTYIYRCVTGTCTAVAGDPTQIWVSGDVLKATISDTSGLITVYKNDVSFMTYTDPSPLTGTRTGIGSFSANALGDIELDDFYVGGTPIPDITGRIIKIQVGQTLKLGQQ